MSNGTPNPRRRRTVRHFLVLDRLDPRHHRALRELLLGKNVRLTTVQDWLAALDVDVPYHALHSYRQHLRAERERATREAEDVDREALLAVGYAALAAGAAWRGFDDLPDFLEASLALCELLLPRAFQALTSEYGAPPLTPKQLTRYADMIPALAAAREAFERTRCKTNLN